MQIIAVLLVIYHHTVRKPAAHLRVLALLCLNFIVIETYISVQVPQTVKQNEVKIKNTQSIFGEKSCVVCLFKLK